MRTAQEYIKQSGFFDGDQFDSNAVSKMINESRKEAIEECAKRAVSVSTAINLYDQIPSPLSNPKGHTVDKQSILSIIKELK